MKEKIYMVHFHVALKLLESFEPHLPQPTLYQSIFFFQKSTISECIVSRLLG